MVAAEIAVVRYRGAGFQPAGGEDDTCTRAGNPRHGERLQPGQMQRDMWVMHSTGHGDALGVRYDHKIGSEVPLGAIPHHRADAQL